MNQVSAIVTNAVASVTLQLRTEGFSERFLWEVHTTNRPLLPQNERRERDIWSPGWLIFPPQPENASKVCKQLQARGERQKRLCPHPAPRLRKGAIREAAGGLPAEPRGEPQILKTGGEASTVATWCSCRWGAGLQGPHSTQATSLTWGSPPQQSGGTLKRSQPWSFAQGLRLGSENLGGEKSFISIFVSL